MPSLSLLLYSTVPDQTFDKIKQLLKSRELPIDDISHQMPFAVAKHTDDSIIGCCGLEFHPPYGLLRSLAVDPGFQQKGLGKRLVNEIFTLAQKQRILSLYLLTETAPRFFQKIGFEIISRNEVPAVIQQTSEYSHVCPDSATVMKYEIH